MGFAYDRRERIETEDGDFLDLDWAHSAPSDAHSHVAILVHGLEGNTHRRYMRGMARALCQNRPEWDVCALNLRGCSGEMNRRIASYHSGKTDDLARVVGHVLSQQYDAVSLVGFSLGGNIVLKYLGDCGSGITNCIRAAVGISVPVHLASSSEKIGRLSNWHYTQYFLHSLSRKIRAKARQHPNAVPLEPLDQIRTLWDFDDAYTAPLHGFQNAAEYYRRASSKPVLSNIRVPTLLLNARNDPFLTPQCYPTSIARKHQYLALEMPDSGGHVGFVDVNDDGEYWSERRVASFLSAPRTNQEPTDRASSPESSRFSP